MPADTITQPSSSTVPKLTLSAKEAAAALDIGKTLLWEMTNRGELPCVRIGRRVLFPVDGLRKYLERNTEGGAR